MSTTPSSEAGQPPCPLAQGHSPDLILVGSCSLCLHPAVCLWPVGVGSDCHCCMAFRHVHVPAGRWTFWEFPLGVSRSRSACAQDVSTLSCGMCQVGLWAPGVGPLPSALRLPPDRLPGVPAGLPTGRGEVSPQEAVFVTFALLAGSFSLRCCYLTCPGSNLGTVSLKLIV